jgi:CheY-like chemotaxis protein
MVFLPSADQEAEPRRVAQRIPAPARSAGFSQPCRILIVDDNPDTANSLAMLLELKGTEVEVCYDGPSALETLNRTLRDIVILDIGMPGMDGLEVARRIRARPEYRHIRLIALTGLGEAADRRRSLEAGFDRHLVKPISFDTLDSILHDLGGQKPSAADTAPELAPVDSLVSPLLHDLAQPLSAAGCYAAAARALAAGSAGEISRLSDALNGIDKQIERANAIMERLRETVRSPRGPVEE